jgi:cephalosporin-C deacetylase-like acetyl esterase
MLDHATELHVNKQQIVQQFQHYEAGKHFQRRLGGGSSFRITWPALPKKESGRGPACVAGHGWAGRASVE